MIEETCRINYVTNTDLNVAAQILDVLDATSRPQTISGIAKHMKVRDANGARVRMANQPGMDQIRKLLPLLIRRKEVVMVRTEGRLMVRYTTATQATSDHQD